MSTFQLQCLLVIILPEKRSRSCTHAPPAAPAAQNARRWHRVLRLPRQVEVHVAKCHTCHANSRGNNGVHWEPSAPPEPAQRCKCHACHAECTSMLPSATLATPSGGPCRQVPRLPRKQPRRQRRPLETKSQPSAISATLATQNACRCHQVTPTTPSGGPCRQGGRCRQVRRLPRKQRSDNGVDWEPSVPPEPAQCRKCHACHAECTSMSPSATPATPATPSGGPCRQVPRLPRKQPPTGNQARHQSQPSAASGTPATQNARRCHQVLRLPCQVEVHGIHWEPSAPPEPAVEVNVAKCHACHANSYGDNGVH